MEKIGSILPNSETVKEIERTLQFKQEWLNHGFIQIPNQMPADTTVSIGARLLYILLMRRVFQRDFCYPGQVVLSKEMGVSDRYIRKLLKELEDNGWIEVKRRGLGKTNIYFLLKYD